MLSLPEEIMMVRNGRYGRFRDQFRQSDPQRQVQGNGQCIFRHQQLDIVFFDKAVELLLEQQRRAVQFFRNLDTALLDTETLLVEIQNVRVTEMGFRHHERTTARGVQLAGKIKTVEPGVLEHLRPFLGFQ